MTTATLTSKGRVTIPLSVRKALRLKTGNRIEFVKTDDGQYAIMTATKSVRDLKGMLPKPPNSVSIEDKNAAKAAGMKNIG